MQLVPLHHGPGPSQVQEAEAAVAEMLVQYQLVDAEDAALYAAAVKMFDAISSPDEEHAQAQEQEQAGTEAAAKAVVAKEEVAEETEWVVETPVVVKEEEKAEEKEEEKEEVEEKEEEETLVAEEGAKRKGAHAVDKRLQQAKPGKQQQQR
jgi:hypothetical protein